MIKRSQSILSSFSNFTPVQRLSLQVQFFYMVGFVTNWTRYRSSSRFDLLNWSGPVFRTLHNTINITVEDILQHFNSIIKQSSKLNELQQYHVPWWLTYSIGFQIVANNKHRTYEQNIKSIIG